MREVYHSELFFLVFFPKIFLITVRIDMLWEKKVATKNMSTVAFNQKQSSLSNSLSSSTS